MANVVNPTHILNAKVFRMDICCSVTRKLLSDLDETLQYYNLTIRITHRLPITAITKIYEGGAEGNG